ncbi:MAG: CoA-binding protein, partial [Gammaproteobacteria bacterium]
MSVRNLNRLFDPKSVAVIGASDRGNSLGGIVLRNVLAAGFEGRVLPIHPEAETVADLEAYKDVAALPELPDLAVICTPPPTVPKLIAQL